MGKLTRNSLPSHSLQSEFHRRIKVMPGFTKRLQGLVMQEFREVVEEPNPKAVRFAEALCEGAFDNEWGSCMQCGHGSNSEERHSDDCMYQEALKFLGRPVWVRPPDPKFRTKNVWAGYLKPGMHLVVNDALEDIRAISASTQGSPAWWDVCTVTADGEVKHHHLEKLDNVAIPENE